MTEIDGPEAVDSPPREKRAFKIEASELSPYNKALAEAREAAISRLPSATSRSEHMALTHAARIFTPTNSGWAEEHYDDTPKPDELLGGTCLEGVT